MQFYVIWFPLTIILSASANVLPSPSVSDPTITPAPQVPVELLKKQNDDRFMGWVSWRGTWSSERCDLGGTWYQSGDYAGCCATTAASCNFPVGCVSGSLVYTFRTPTGTLSRTTIACISIYTDSPDRPFSICNTGFIYENNLDSDPQTDIFCGRSSLNWSYYRVKPEESSSSSFTPASTPRSTPATPTPITTSPTSPTPEPGKKSESKAWIAGAVVGPIALIAIAGLIAWIILLKRKKRSQNQNQHPLPPSYPHQSYPTSPQPEPPKQYMAYRPPQMQQTQPGMTPYGVTGGGYSPGPQSPTSPGSNGSNSPMPPASPYGPLSQSPGPGQQQWQQPQPMQQPTSPQMLNPQQGGFVVDDGGVNKVPSPRPFSSELDSTTYYPQQQQPGILPAAAGREMDDRSAGWGR